MEAPTPITPIDLNEIKNDNINKVVKKEYNIEINDEKYKLILILENKFIYLKIYKLNDIVFIYYENRFNLKDINNILDKNSNICNNLEEVIDLIDSSYENKKLIINNNKDNIMNIIIKYPIVYKERECIIKLNKKEIEINEKFKMILNEIELIKKERDKIINDKLNNIEKLLLELKEYIIKKLEENKNIINKLKSINEKNVNNLEKNKEEMKLLKNDIFIIKYPKLKEYYKKYNFNKKINIYKLDLSGKGIGDNEMIIKDLQNIYFKELKELNLSFNNISDIKVLEKVKFEKLKVLDLSENKISDINIFEKVNFKELKKLYLSENQIENKSNSSIIEYLKSKISYFYY